MSGAASSPTGADHELARWARDIVETRLAAGEDRSLVLWAVICTASVSSSVSADPDAVLGAVVRAVIAADEARWTASIASGSPAGGVR